MPEGDGSSHRGQPQRGEDARSSHEYWDTFDHTFKRPASAVTQYEGTHHPKSFAQLLVAFPVG